MQTRPSQLPRGAITVALGVTTVLAIVLAAVAWPSEPWRRTGPTIAVAGWVPYWQEEEAMTSFTANSAAFADVSLVAYAVTSGGSLAPYPGLDPAVAATFRQRARSAGVPFLVTVFDDSPAGEMAALLADPSRRRDHVAALTSLVVDGDFDGIDLDYEQFAFADPKSTWEATSPNWIALLRELGAALRSTGRTLVVSVPPAYDGKRTDRSGYWVYDHAAMGEIVDRIRIMAYDYSTASPGPIAPIEWVHDVIRAARSLVDPTKLDLGIPAYGRDWVTSVEGTCPTGRRAERRSHTTTAAAALATERGVQPEWDEHTAEVRFDYTDVLTGFDASGLATTCTVHRTVRYLDARAIHRRAYAAYRGDLHGIALWALGNEDPSTWTALDAARAGLDEWPQP